MSNPLCGKPAPPTGWATVASLLHSEAFLSAIRQAREAASPFGDCGGDDDDYCVPCIGICPAVRDLQEDLEAMMHEQDECEHQLDICHALAQHFADESTNLKAEIREAKRILAIKESLLQALLAITPEPGADGEGPLFII
jgi:hypothetical protein